MPFKMGFDSAALKGPEPLPSGIYEVRLEGFAPKLSKAKEGKSPSVNLNGIVVVVGNPEYDGRKVFAGLNEQIPGWIQDFVHSFGLEMEDQLGDAPAVPGIFDADPTTFKADDPSTWKYAGPLLGRTAKWELGVRTYQGKEQQDIRQFICSVPNCASLFPSIKHAKDMGSK